MSRWLNEALITHFSCQNYLSIVEVTEAVGYRDQSGSRQCYLAVRPRCGHRVYFLPVVINSEEQHATPPTTPVALADLAFCRFLYLPSLVLPRRYPRVLRRGAVKSASAPAVVVGNVRRFFLPCRCPLVTVWLEARCNAPNPIQAD